MYTWHFTFADQPAITALAASYEHMLAGLPDLEMVPSQWLHLTTQGVAFTDEIGQDDVTAIISQARDRIKDIPPLRVTLGPARVTPEAVLLDVAPADGLVAIRSRLREAIATVRGMDQVLDGEQWVPHVSVAYSSGTAPVFPYVEAVSPGGTAECVISDVDLIELNRDHRMYEWDTVATARLEGQYSSG